jgi:hypothetical protein
MTMLVCTESWYYNCPGFTAGLCHYERHTEKDVVLGNEKLRIALKLRYLLQNLVILTVLSLFIYLSPFIP